MRRSVVPLAGFILLAALVGAVHGQEGAEAGGGEGGGENAALEGPTVDAALRALEDGSGGGSGGGRGGGGGSGVGGGDGGGRGGGGGGGSGRRSGDMIDYRALQSSKIITKPFRHVVLRNAIANDTLRAINADFPPTLMKKAHMDEDDLVKAGELLRTSTL